ncbi:N-acetyltransferase family protein [Micromonospora sp. CA-249363]|uniref:GNAT family N-acetyltransferase n=1 Tax=Micromonospora sp. CA-249363 TaxID=3239963 RepID=UPI003D8F465F
MRFLVNVCSGTAREAAASVAEVATAAGHRLRIRPATAEDLDLVNHFHLRDCSAASRAARYHAGRDRIRASEWRHLTQPDNGYTLLVSTDDQDRLVGLAHLLWQESAPPEVAILIADDWQEVGVGTAVARWLAGLAAAHGHRVQQAYIPPGNVRALRLARHFGAIVDRLG